MKTIKNFNILRKIHKGADTNQRALAKQLGLSIGKLNYSLKALKNKGLIKIKNYNKLSYNILSERIVKLEFLIREILLSYLISGIL